MKTNHKTLFVAITLLLGACLSGIQAQTARKWISIGAGNYTWSDGANWNGGDAPDTAAESAQFSANSGSTLLMTGTYNLNLAVPTTLGGILMVSSSGTPTSEVQIGGSVLTMDNGASAAQIRMDAGQPRLVINSDIENSGSGGMSLSTNSASIVINGSISGNMVTKNGSGAVFLGGTNSWSGGTNLDAGYLVATSTSAFGFAGTLRLGSAANIVGISTLASGTTTVSNALDFNTTNTVNLLSGGSGSTLEFSTSSISNTSNGALTIARAVGSGYGAAAYGIADPTGTGVVKFSGSDFSILRNISVTSGQSNVELSPASGTQTFTGSFSSSAKLIKSGNGTVAYQGNITSAVVDVNLGTMILSGTNSYSGATTISGGKLVVGDGATGLIGNTVLSVSAGTLTGSLASGNNIGTSLVTIGNGAGSADSIITAGSETAGSIGRLSLAGALTLASDANFVFDLNTTSGVGDQVLAADTTTISGSSLFTFNAAGSNAGIFLGQTFSALGGAGAITGQFSNLANNGFISSNGLTLQANNYTGVGDLVLTVTAVPEPTTWLLIVSAGGILFLRRRVVRGNV